MLFRSTDTDPWRVLRIQGEFVEGFDALSKIGPAVAVFGSARCSKESPYYQAAAKTTEILARAGLAIITGGGPGTATELLSIYTWRVNFRQWDLGYGAVSAFMVYLVVLILCAVFYKAVYWTEGRQKL